MMMLVNEDSSFHLNIVEITMCRILNWFLIMIIYLVTINDNDDDGSSLIIYPY